MGSKSLFLAKRNQSSTGKGENRESTAIKQGGAGRGRRGELELAKGLRRRMSDVGLGSAVQDAGMPRCDDYLRGRLGNANVETAAVLMSTVDNKMV